MTRSVKLAVLGSLLLNLLLLGILGGHLFHRFDKPPCLENVLAGSELSKERQEFLLTKIRENMKSKPRREELQAQREALGHILSAETFDRDAFSEHLQEINALRDYQRKVMTERFTEFAATLPAQERRVLAELMRYKFKPCRMKHR